MLVSMSENYDPFPPARRAVRRRLRDRLVNLLAGLITMALVLVVLFAALAFFVGIIDGTGTSRPYGPLPSVTVTAPAPTVAACADALVQIGERNARAHRTASGPRPEACMSLGEHDYATAVDAATTRLLVILPATGGTE